MQKNTSKTKVCLHCAFSEEDGDVPDGRCVNHARAAAETSRAEMSDTDSSEGIGQEWAVVTPAGEVEVRKSEGGGNAPPSTFKKIWEDSLWGRQHKFQKDVDDKQLFRCLKGGKDGVITIVTRKILAHQLLTCVSDDVFVGRHCVELFLVGFRAPERPQRALPSQTGRVKVAAFPQEEGQEGATTTAGTRGRGAGVRGRHRRGATGRPPIQIVIYR